MAGVIENILNFFNGIFHKEHVQIVRIGQAQTRELDKVLEYDRGLARGEAAGERVLRENAERFLKQKDEINLTEQIAKGSAELKFAQFQGSFSWRKLFTTMSKGKKIKITSHDMVRDFGDFDDLLTLTDGRMAVIAKNRKTGKKTPVITGSDLRTIFKNFGGLPNGASKGFLIINLDENGSYTENILAKEIPNIVVDETGTVHFDQFNPSEIIEQIKDKDERINGLMGRVSEARMQAEAERQAKLQAQNVIEHYKTRAEASEAQMSQALKSTAAVISNFNDISKENAGLSQGQKIAEDFAEAVESQRDQIYAKSAMRFSQESLDRAKQEVKEGISWAADAILPPILEAKNQPQPQQPSQSSTTIVQPQPQPKTMVVRRKKG